MLFQVIAMQPSDRWTCEMMDPEVLSGDLDHARYPNKAGGPILQPITRQLAENEG
jgi:hypothetical protein